MNKCILYGNVGRDPEVKTIGSGQVVAKFTVATSEKVKDEYRTEWHNITAWGKKAEFVQKYLHKGMKVLVEGTIHYSTYENQKGEKVYKTEINAQNFSLSFDKKKEANEDYQEVKFDEPAFDDSESIPF